MEKLFMIGMKCKELYTFYAYKLLSDWLKFVFAGATHAMS